MEPGSGPTPDWPSAPHHGDGAGPERVGPAATAPARKAGLRRTLLRFPLFYKIFIANAAIVAVVIVVAIAHTELDAHGTHLLTLLGFALLASLATNGLIVRLALIPLRRLEQTAERVQAGDTQARVEPSELADRDLERLTATFNTMLEVEELYRHRLRTTAARALAAQEEERKRIARELHDGIAQTLTALRVRMRIARALEDGAARQQLLERVSAELGEATEEIRRIAQGLRPPALDMLGLAAAIESCARGLDDDGGIALATNLEPVDGLLSPEAELVLYRVMQEALSNAVRHSRAGSVTVGLSYAGRVVTAVVEDDGRGFDVTTEMSNGGLGLFGMQERAAYVGGTVEIDSEPGRGTRVRATIPVLETARYA